MAAQDYMEGDTMKFGRLPAKRDPRTLKLQNILARELPPIPAMFVESVIPTPVFGNLQHGCCVISARAHATLRFEQVEQGALIQITEADVLRAWRAENGDTEDGLYMLDSQRAWRAGWLAAGNCYNSAAFASVDPCDSEHVRAGIFLFGSLQAGLSLPYSVTEDGIDPWVIVPGSRSATDPDGGHAVTIVGYDKAWMTVVTWGKRVKMSWAFFEAYCEELYAVVDDLDKWRVGAPGIDVPALEAYLRQLAA